MAQPPAALDYGPAPDGSYTLRPEPAPTLRGALGGDLTVSRIGPLLGGLLTLEGQRLGVVFGYTAAFASATGIDDYDTLHLAQARLSYALLSGARGRLRAEVGIHFAAAPELNFFAPGAGISGELQLFGPIGLETRIYGNAAPFTQLDARAGLRIASRTTALSLGMRALYLDDNGALGAINAGDTSEMFYGPYAALGFAL